MNEPNYTPTFAVGDIVRPRGGGVFVRAGNAETAKVTCIRIYHCPMEGPEWMADTTAGSYLTPSLEQVDPMTTTDNAAPIVDAWLAEPEGYGLRIERLAESFPADMGELTPWLVAACDRGLAVREAALQARVDALEGALRPFANIGVGSNPDWRPEIRMDRDAILAARAALAEGRSDA